MSEPKSKLSCPLTVTPRRPLAQKYDNLKEITPRTTVTSQCK